MDEGYIQENTTSFGAISSQLPEVNRDEMLRGMTYFDSMIERIKMYLSTNFFVVNYIAGEGFSSIKFLYETFRRNTQFLGVMSWDPKIGNLEKIQNNIIGIKYGKHSKILKEFELVDQTYYGYIVYFDLIELNSKDENINTSSIFIENMSIDYIIDHLYGSYLFILRLKQKDSYTINNNFIYEEITFPDCMIVLIKRRINLKAVTTINHNYLQAIGNAKQQIFDTLEYPYTFNYQTISIQQMFELIKKFKLVFKDENKGNFSQNFRGDDFDTISKKTVVISDPDGINVDEIIDYFTEDIRCKTIVNGSSNMNFFIERKKEFIDETVNDCILNKRNFNIKMIKEFIERGRHNANYFKTTLMTVLISISNAKKILDPSAGWGDRLLGAIVKDCEYLGFDPNTELKKGHDKIISIFGNSAKQRVVYEAFENQKITEKFDAVITSPPFYTHERYSDKGDQSVINYPRYEDWVIKFFCKYIFNAWNCLDNNGYMLIYISDTKEVRICEIMLYFVSLYCENCEFIGVFSIIGYSGKHRPLWIWRKRSVEITKEKLNSLAINFSKHYSVIYKEIIKIYGSKEVVQEQAKTIKVTKINLRIRDPLPTKVETEKLNFDEEFEKVNRDNFRIESSYYTILINYIRTRLTEAFNYKADENPNKQILDAFIDFCIQPENTNIFIRAFTHISYEKDGFYTKYEYLEPLGDKHLDSAFTDVVYEKYGQLTDQEFTEIRNRYVSREELSRLGSTKMRFEIVRRCNPRIKNFVKIDEDMVETFIGAIYTIGDKMGKGIGSVVVYHFVKYLYSDVEMLAEKPVITRLKELIQDKFGFQILYEYKKQDDGNYVCSIPCPKDLKDFFKNMPDILGAGSGSKQVSKTRAATMAIENLKMGGFTEEILDNLRLHMIIDNRLYGMYFKKVSDDLNIKYGKSVTIIFKNIYSSKNFHIVGIVIQKDGKEILVSSGEGIDHESARYDSCEKYLNKNKK